MGIRFSAAAIKASFLVEHPNFYTLKCKDVKHKPSADGQSINYFYIWEGLDGELQGVEVTHMANSKADWIHYPIFKAANGGKDLPADSEVNPEDMKDVVLQGYVKRGERQDGTPQNVIVEWRPVPTPK